VRIERTTLLLLVCLTASAYAAAQGAVQITSTQALDKRIPVAVPPFATAQPELSSACAEMAQVVAFDLDFSGLFAVLPQSRYPAAFKGFDPKVTTPNWDLWRTSKAEYLVHGIVRQDGNQLVTEFRLYDLFHKERVVGQELRVAINYPRLASHRFTEEVIRFIDGELGIGTTQLIFSAGQPGKKEIYIADYDGAGAIPLTRHNSISIKPKISPDGNRAVYLSYKDRYAYLYILDLNTGKSSPFSKEVGLNASPNWTRDGKQIALTLSKDGNTEIYLRGASGGSARRLTRNRFGDTQPTFSPDGAKIAFISDRGGPTQVYSMDANGGNQSRISHQGGSTYDPIWSPDGRYIAYVVLQSGQGFEIWMMNANGTDPRRLTKSTGNNESPTWSPDSKHVAFVSTRSGRSEIWSVTIATGSEHKLSRINLSCEGPSWGPRRR
jgi:TolB protein